MSSCRRCHPRIDTHMMTDIRPRDSRLSRERVEVINISLGGLAFLSSKKFSKGKTIVVKFIDSDYDGLGVIRRSELRGSQYLHAIEFKNISYINTKRRFKLISGLADDNSLKN